jgi:hypothetical protein
VVVVDRIIIEAEDVEAVEDMVGDVMAVVAVEVEGIAISHTTTITTTTATIIIGIAVQEIDLEGIKKDTIQKRH